MRFSLLSLVGLIALVAFEVITLKTPSETRLVIVGYLVYASLLVATWGAFCGGGKFRQFCKGFAVLAWASVLYGIFVREESFVNFAVSPLAKLAAEFLEHPVPTDLDPFSSRNADRTEYLFFKIWNYWGILNAGVFGGFLALQIRVPMISAPLLETNSPSQELVKQESPEFISSVKSTPAAAQDRVE